MSPISFAVCVMRWMGRKVRPESAQPAPNATRRVNRPATTRITSDNVCDTKVLRNPDTGCNELAIVREDDDPNTTVYTGIPEMSLLNFRWAKDDSFISFSGGLDLSTVGSEMA